ncbi:MAG: PAS domain S-box protein [Nitrospira sp. CR1.1]|jgi:PAS domain S-box-containing protein|nr:PAS domain S-box protein [Nitrospira sp. CR1.1]
MPWYVFCAGILLGTLLLDVYTPWGVPVSLFYLLAVVAVGMVSGSRMHWIVTAISTGLTALGLYWSSPGSVTWVEATNRAISIGALWLTAWIVWQWQKCARSRSHGLSARLRSLLTHSQTIIFVKDLQGRYLEVSEQYLTLIGAPVEMVIGKTDHELFPPDIADSYRQHDREVVHAGEAMSFEEGARLNGDPRFYVVRKFPLRDEAGRIVAVGGVATDMTARLQAEVARHEAQDRLDLVLAATQTGIWDWDLRTNTTYYSTRWKSSLGYEEAEISNSPSEWEFRLHPDDKQRAFGLVDDCFSGRIASYELEHRLRHKDGTYRWIHTCAVLQRDDQGHPRRMTGSHVDITERKRAEEALSRSESTLRSFFESDVMMMGIVELQDGDILHLSDNRCAARFFGTQPEFMQGRLASDLGVSPDVIALWRRYYETSRESVQPVRFEGSYPHPTSGAERRLSVAVCWIGAGPGGRDRYSYVAEDITEARRTETALGETAERYRGLVTALAEGVLLHDAQGSIIACNPSAERILGVTRDQLMQSTPVDPYWQAIHADGRPFEQDLRPPMVTLRTGRPCADVIMGVCRPSGEQRWLSVNTQPLKKPDDEHPYAVVSSFHDITDRRRAEQALLEVQSELEQRVRERTARIHELEFQRSQAETVAALGHLAAEIAHEVNNPLAGIKNAFHLVKQGISPDHRHYRFVELIDREIQRLVAIMKKMYTLHQGGASDQWQATNVGDLLQNVATLLDYKLASRRIRLRTEMEITCPVVALPRADLFQVLLNLVQNAIDASPADTDVVLKVAQRGDMFHWSVMDQGTGIAPEVFPRMFEPFFTTKSADDRQGLGLGLSVSRRLVCAMGGRIEVHMQPAGWTTFTVIHPLDATDSKKQQGALPEMNKEQEDADYAKTHSHC